MSGKRLSAFGALLAAPAIALAAPGDLDTTFGGTGTVVTALAPGLDTAWGVLVQPDGKIVAAGLARPTTTDFAVARYDASGSLDASFGSGGVAITPIGTGDEIGRAVVRQPDGKLVVAGYARIGTTDDFALVRYDAAGALDATFDSDGKVTTPIAAGSDRAFALALQPDGKLVAAGWATMATIDFAVVRYDADGSLDAGFGTGGIATTPIGLSTDVANAVAVQADGKIVVAGYTSNAGVFEVAVVRYESDGSLDGSFGAGGIVTTPISGTYALGTALAVQPDGKLLIAGSTGSPIDFAVVRYESDGSLDAGFGTGGTVVTSIGPGNDQARAIALQPDGSLVVAGFTNVGSGNDDIALVKYDEDGALDTTFGSGGVVTTSTSSGSDGLNGLALQADGRLVGAGFTGPLSTPDFVVARYLNAVCGNGDLEGAEACDAGGANGTPGSCCTAACTLVGTGTECRPAAGSCDVAETCSGSSAACPADALVPAATVCRAGSGDACDPAETCSGSGPACPPDVVTPGGTACRTGSGDLCDPTETCSGVAGDPCPADSVSGAFVVCRPAAGGCDVAETCSGTPAEPCPSDAVAPNATLCRPAAGVCDVAESCDGIGVSCPADAKSTAVCRPSAGVCDLAESCTGVADTCPADAFEPASTVCRPAAGACDLAESCTGSGATCPADTGLPDGDGDSVCDAADNCDAVANASQANGDGDALGDACDPCTNLVPTVPSKHQLSFNKLLAPAADETFKLKGFFTGVPGTPTIDPVANGLRVLVTDATGATPLDVTIAGGAYDVGTRTGWRANGGGTAWVWKGPGTATNGIQKAQLKAVSSTPGKYKVSVKGKNGTYPVNLASLPLTGTVVIDTPLAATGQCVEATFLATPPARPSCIPAGGGKVVKCK